LIEHLYAVLLSDGGELASWNILPLYQLNILAGYQTIFFVVMVKLLITIIFEIRNFYFINAVIWNWWIWYICNWSSLLYAATYVHITVIQHALLLRSWRRRIKKWPPRRVLSTPLKVAISFKKNSFWLKLSLIWIWQVLLFIFNVSCEHIHWLIMLILDWSYDRTLARQSELMERLRWRSQITWTKLSIHWILSTIIIYAWPNEFRIIFI